MQKWDQICWALFFNTTLTFKIILTAITCVYGKDLWPKFSGKTWCAKKRLTGSIETFKICGGEAVKLHKTNCFFFKWTLSLSLWLLFLCFRHKCQAVPVNLQPHSNLTCPWGCELKNRPFVPRIIEVLLCIQRRVLECDELLLTYHSRKGKNKTTTTKKQLVITMV